MYETNRPTNPQAEELLFKYFPVLDHGFVSLVDYSGTDQCIERAARVSYGAGTRQKSQTEGLLRYLKRHKHTTPFEMVELKFHCCMPIFVARQWIRHRTANVNEYSGRYSLMPMLFYTPEKEQFQLQSKNNNQGRDGDVEGAVYHTANGMIQYHREVSQDVYKYMTANDVAREIARIDLPLSTYTQWYWKIDLHNLFHFLTLRVDSHAQWEIQQYGKVMAGMLKRVAPLAYDAWIDYDVCGESFSYDQLKVIRRLISSEFSDDQLVLGTARDDYVVESGKISSRELKEFYDKLQPVNKPDFELDLSVAKPPEYFEQKMADAVPNASA